MTLSRVGAITLGAGENQVECGVIDDINGFAYFATNTSPVKVVKIRLSDFTQVGTLNLTSGNLIRPMGAVIDKINGFAYFCTYDSGKISKVRLSDFTEVAVLSTSASDGIYGAVIDAVNGFIYIGRRIITGGDNYFRIRLSTFTQITTMGTSQQFKSQAPLIDISNQVLYWGSSSNNPTIIKRIIIFGPTSNLTLIAGDAYAYSGVIDENNGFSYYGMYTAPGRIVKFNHLAFTRVGHVTLNAGEEECMSADISPQTGFAYFGTNDNLTPGNVVKIRLSDFTRVEGIALSSGENFPYSLLLDKPKGFGYIGTLTTPGRIVKFSDPDMTPVSAVSNILGKSSSRSTGASVSGGIACGRGKKRR